VDPISRFFFDPVVDAEDEPRALKWITLPFAPFLSPVFSARELLPSDVPLPPDNFAYCFSPGHHSSTRPVFNFCAPRYPKIFRFRLLLNVSLFRPLLFVSHLTLPLFV